MGVKGPKSRIDFEKFQRLLRQQKGVREMARELKCSPALICKMMKQREGEIARDINLRSAPYVVELNLNAVEQLQKINQGVFSQLDVLEKYLNGDKETVRQVDSDLDSELYKRAKLVDPRRLHLHICAEIRSQIELQMNILRTLYDFKAVEEFQKSVIEGIGEAAPDVRDRIVQKLREKQTLRSTLTLPKPIGTNDDNGSNSRS